MKNKNDDLLNEKMTEMNGLRQQMSEQNKIILRQKEEMKGKGTANKGIVNDEKYNNLKKAYDSLRRDHEDLLVYVGHLDEKLKRIQMKRSQNQQPPNDAQ